eukprot:jgi/Mesvir1/14633/Mv05303-RA.1
MRKFVPWCHPAKGPNGRDDLMADVVVMSCILRSVTVVGASKRLAAARDVAALLHQSPEIPNSVFGVGIAGGAEGGRYSDLVVTPLPKGVVTADQMTRANHPVITSMNQLAVYRFALQEMRKANVPEDVRLRFREEIKEMAGIAPGGLTTAKPCDPGWEFVKLADESVGMSLRMFGLAQSTLILHSVSTQFDRVKDFAVHFAPENRLFDTEWIAKTDDDAHFVATGMSKERFRQLQTNLRPGEDEKHAYHPHTLSMYDYVRWVLYGLADHSSSRADLVSTATDRFGQIAARFGSQILARNVTKREDIERSMRVADVERMRHLRSRAGVDVQEDEEEMDDEEDEDDDMEDTMWSDGIPFPP